MRMNSAGPSELGTEATDATSFQPHPIFGFVCPVLKAGVSLP
jgi:hypothetical protein